MLSDPHTYDLSLGTDGQAFEQYLASDRKLLRDSPEIHDAALPAIAHARADFVLVAGDLTKDGEAASHRLMARYSSAGGSAR